MKARIITSENISRFKTYLLEEEKSSATIEKYLRDVAAFMAYVGDANVCKDMVIAYKQHLQEKGYAVRSINSMLASLNSFFCCFGWGELRVKSLKLQHSAFCPEEKELTRVEYERLCRVADKKTTDVSASSSRRFAVREFASVNYRI